MPESLPYVGSNGEVLAENPYLNVKEEKSKKKNKKKKNKKKKKRDRVEPHDEFDVD